MVLRDKTWNEMWICPICEKWHNAAKSDMHLIRIVVGFELAGNGVKAKMGLQGIDDECFKKYKLDNKQPNIVVPRKGIAMPDGSIKNI